MIVSPGCGMRWLGGVFLWRWWQWLFGGRGGLEAEVLGPHCIVVSAQTQTQYFSITGPQGWMHFLSVKSRHVMVHCGSCGAPCGGFQVVQEGAGRVFYLMILYETNQAINTHFLIPLLTNTGLIL